MAVNPVFTTRALKRMTPYRHGKMTFRGLDDALTSLQGLRRGSRLNLIRTIVIAQPVNLRGVSVIRPGSGLFQGGTAPRLTGELAKKAARLKVACGVAHLAVMPSAIQHQLALALVSHIELHASFDGLASLLLTSMFILQEAKDKAGYGRAVAAWNNFYKQVEMDATEAVFDPAGKMLAALSTNVLGQLSPQKQGIKTFSATDAAAAIFDIVSKVSQITDDGLCEGIVTGYFAISGAIAGFAAAGALTEGIAAPEGAVEGFEVGHIGGDLWSPTICGWGAGVVEDVGKILNETEPGGTDPGADPGVAPDPSGGEDPGMTPEPGTDPGADPGVAPDPSGGEGPGTTPNPDAPDTPDTPDNSFPDPDAMPDPDGAGGFTADTFAMMTFAQAKQFMSSVSKGVFAASNLPAFQSPVTTVASLGSLRGVVSRQSIVTAETLGMTQATMVSPASILVLNTLKPTGLGALAQIPMYGQ